ncbi:hypothetical protein [Moorena sp. SIO2C4]|uniref:hypothetical protein n=1 Tax=Moorena sp. SIO2C4 TaxID=2607824 RepID=UPI0013C7B0FA|nr:hypothetical protein [Moorena sp. SIO2C4]NES44889.1 hypothetical protein [Moorena sp. SIO2C4]
MEPLAAAVVAISTVLATKALEKTGENVGQVVWNQTSQFLESLRKQSPDTVTAIENAPEVPLDFDDVVLQVEAAAQDNSEVAQAMQELAAAAQAEPNPKFAEIIAMPNLQKLAEKIGQVVMPGGQGRIDKMEF